MLRLSKRLAVCLVAISIAWALVAAAAQGAPAHFFVETLEKNVLFTAGEDTLEKPFQTFETKFGVIECEFFHGTATEPPTSSELTLGDIEYWSNIPFEEGPCEALGLEAEINFNECHYTLNAGTWNGAGMATGSLDVDCPEGQRIEFNVGNLCRIYVPEQVGLTRVTYTNVENVINTVRVDFEVSNFFYEGEGILCMGNGKDGAYDGDIEIAATEDVFEGNFFQFAVVKQ